MLFSSPIFLFAFLPIFFTSFYLAKGVWRDVIVLAASVFFYAWGAPLFVMLVLASAAFDYWLGGIVWRKRSRLAVSVGVASNLAILFYFKYTNFFIDNINDVFLSSFGLKIAHLNIILPIGVSFIVFEKITYLVDLKRNITKPAETLSKYITYVFLFPKILAGPIIKYHDIQEQLSGRTVSFDDFAAGALRFMFGLSKKILIADTCGEMVDRVFGDVPHISSSGAWVGALCFTVQIYFDFSAYSDMAIGLARMMGFRLMENFNSPYISRSFTEFWRRWHISLSTWIREYLYIPLGGNRGGVWRTNFNLWICFVLSGLWHGSTWNFVIWGAYNGCFLIFDKYFWLKNQTRLAPWLQAGLTLFFVIFGWVIFRSPTVGVALEMIKKMIIFRADGITPFVDNGVKCALILGLAGSLFTWKSTNSMLEKIGVDRALALSAGSIVLLAMAAFSIGKAVTVSFQPFLYFRF